MIRQGSLSAAPRPAAPEQKSIPPLAWAGIAFLGIIWGGSFLSNALLLRELGVLTTVAERVTLAAFALWVYVIAARLPVPRSLTVWRDFTIMGVLNVALPFSLIVWAQQFVASGLASIINAGTAIFGVLIAAIVFADERLTARKATGVLLGFTGVATAIGLDALLAFDLSSKGQIALIGATISYGFGGAFARARLTSFKPEVAAAGMLTGSAALMVPYALIVEGAPPFAMSLTTWAAMAYLSLIATSGAFLLYYRTMPIVGAGNQSLVTLLVSPVAIVIGALVLDESLPTRAYAGFALLALGLLVIDGRILRLFKRTRP